MTGRARDGPSAPVRGLYDGVKIVPVSEAPLEALRDEFAGGDATAGELREEARDAALDEAGS